MIIQYGYITLFAAAFPIAPLMALMNNIIEIRTDAFKLCSAYTRPHYKGASNIGTWYYILEFLGIVAVITNCSLIGLSFAALYDAIGVGHEFQVLGVIVILEHLILFSKYLIAVMVPDYPGQILKEMVKADFLKEEKTRQTAIGDFQKAKRTWSSPNLFKKDEDSEDDK